MTRAIRVRPPEKATALAELFKAGFQLGYQQGLKGASLAEAEAAIFKTLCEALQIIENPHPE
jgi:hypothetical protein